MELENALVMLLACSESLVSDWLEWDGAVAVSSQLRGQYKDGDQSQHGFITKRITNMFEVCIPSVYISHLLLGTIHLLGSINLLGSLN